MSVSIRECQVDQAFQDAIPRATVDELADLKASVERFGYLSPVVAWRNGRGALVLLDGHSRWELWRAAAAMPDGSGGLAAREPAVVVIDLPSHDDAMLFVINGQLGRRNLCEIDRIALVSKREAIVRRLARERQLASLPNKGERGFQSVRSRFAECVGAIANTLVSTNSRKELATEAGVGETTYAAGKLILDAVESGTAQPEVIEDIRTGKATIHGVAKTLKANPTRKAKPSGWQSVVSKFVAACRRFAKQDAARRSEIAAELRRLADEFEGVTTVAAA